MWDDLDHFKLPNPEFLKDRALSTTILSETLVEITNHYLDWAQHEPDTKYNINQLKNRISQAETAREHDLQKLLAKNFENIPTKLQKNRDLQVGWILNNFDEFNAIAKLLVDYKLDLIEKQLKLDHIQARMSAAKHVLDVGRSILSAMKEELRNL